MGRFSRIMGVALAVSICTIPATASAQLAVGSGWQVFQWDGLGAVDSPFGSFVMNEASPFTISVVDCCIGGDEFKLSWTGSSSGSVFTSDASGVNGVSGPGTPAALIAAGFSNGTWTFGPGSYTFVLETSTLATGYETGAGYISADPSLAETVPEPATMTLLATGLAGLVGAGRRRKKA